MEETNDKSLQYVRGYFPQLDGVRGLAIALVLLRHYVYNNLEQDSQGFLGAFRSLISLSWSGVDLFFVLSGFLIGRILISHRNSKNYYTTFYLRRACRILPLYFLLLLTYFSLFLIQNWGHSPGLHWLLSSPAPLWPYPLFLQNISMASFNTLTPKMLSPTWSLAIEEQFYLILPLFIRVIAPRLLLPSLCVLIVAAPIWRFLQLEIFELSSVAAYVLLPARMDTLLLGVLLAVLLSDAKYRERLLRTTPLLLTVSALGVLAFLIQDLEFYDPLLIVVGYSILAVFYFALMSFLLLTKNATVLGVFNNRILRGLGRISYFVYLFHYFFLGLFHHLFQNQAPGPGSSAGLSALALLATLLCGIISWKIFEKPIIDFGHRWSYGEVGRTK